MQKEIQAYNASLPPTYQEMAASLAAWVEEGLSGAESKIWHGHPVWFINENPITGYSLQKKGLRLMFWSGADFEEDQLAVRGSKFKDASVFYNHVSEINRQDLQRWLEKAQQIQWDYKNIVKRKGKLERLF